jgi:arylsulfatase A-like enzyme
MVTAAIQNVLLITLDQFRGDCLSTAGHPVVKTPNLDALSASGVRFANHYSQAAPCGPGRAALYTGTYQMNNRVVANGTPLDPRFTNIALEMAAAGYEPALFGYTDVAVDPRHTTGPDDPRLDDYEGVLPGFTHVLDLSDNVSAWTDWLATMGVVLPGMSGYDAVATEADRPADLSLSAFMTDELIDWIGLQDRPWFAHASYLRPHPPYAAAGRFGTMYDRSDIPTPLPVVLDVHPLMDSARTMSQCAAPADPDDMRRVQAQYYGMISEVDHQVGRLVAGLKASGAWDNTLIVVTADHADQMGDRGLISKLGFYPESFHILGIVRDPRHPSTAGTVVSEFTENVDIMPTILSSLGRAVPLQCDGLSLEPFVAGTTPPFWRDAAHHEFDWRDLFLSMPHDAWPWDRRLERHNLAVLHDASGAYVHFGDGSFLCFDLAADPTWQTMQSDPAIVLSYAQRMLTWRATHADRTLADFVSLGGGRGRWPAGVPWRSTP